ncbi:uncharacterized protein LOC144671530 [Cetorhinus maximus]
MSIVLSLLLTTAVVTGGVRGGKGECPEVKFDGSHPVSLRCSDPSYAKANLVQWRWTDSLGKRKEVLLLQVLNGKVTEHPVRSNLGLSRERCVESGDCSLNMTPTGDDVGLYHCVVWTNARITEEQSLLSNKAGPEALRATYVAVGVSAGGLLLLLALVGLAWTRRRKVTGQGEFEGGVKRPSGDVGSGLDPMALRACSPG